MMRRLLAIVVGLSLLVIPRFAFADPPSVTPCLSTSATPVVCKPGAGTFFGVVNNSQTAQTGTLTYYDNVSACSGTIVASVGALGISQVIMWPAGGKRFVNGLTVCASTTLLTPGVEGYFQ